MLNHRNVDMIIDILVILLRNSIYIYLIHNHKNNYKYSHILYSLLNFCYFNKIK